MLGSAISRRPLVLFALVGLVGLMMALWSTPVSADSDGWDLRVAPGSVTSLSPGSISSGADGASSSSAEATYEWSVTGSCGSFDSTSAQNVLFTAADGTCSGVLSVSVSRAGSDTVNSSVTLHVLGSGEAIVEEVVEEEAEVANIAIIIFIGFGCRVRFLDDASPAEKDSLIQALEQLRLRGPVQT